MSSGTYILEHISRTRSLLMFFKNSLVNVFFSKLHTKPYHYVLRQIKCISVIEHKNICKAFLNIRDCYAIVSAWRTHHGFVNSKIIILAEQYISPWLFVAKKTYFYIFIVLAYIMLNYVMLKLNGLIIVNWIINFFVNVKDFFNFI